jgi:CheY-like chemotaxis protein
MFNIPSKNPNYYLYCNMVTVNQVILVDNDSGSNLYNEKIIKEHGLSEQVKITLNGGHALLYLDHISHKIASDFKVLVLLKMETPIADGFEFLNGYYKESKKIKNKENIIIAVLSDNLSPEKIEKIKGMGQTNFISSPICANVLNNLIIQGFPSSGKQEAPMQAQALSSSTEISLSEKKEKAKRNFRKNQSDLRVA